MLLMLTLPLQTDKTGHAYYSLNPLPNMQPNVFSSPNTILDWTIDS